MTSTTSKLQRIFHIIYFRSISNISLVVDIVFNFLLNFWITWMKFSRFKLLVYHYCVAHLYPIYLFTFFDFFAVFGSLDMSRSNSMTNAGQCRLAPLIACIQDSSQVYDFIVKLLFKLHSCKFQITLLGWN